MKLIQAAFVLAMSVAPFTLWAQQAVDDNVEMADAMRSNGKIYVVVLVAVIILTGLIVYLISLDRKISKLEKRISSKTPS